MAAARPVVSTELGTGTSFVNRDGETGIVVPPGDSTALAAALESLLRAPERSRALGEAGRRRMQELFGADRMVERTMAIYREVLGDDRASNQTSATDPPSPTTPPIA